MEIGKQKKRVIAIGASCLAAGVVAATLMGMGPGGGGGGMPGGGGMGMAREDSNQRTVVEVDTPTIGSVVVTGSFVGTVEPGQQVTVYPKVSGEVLEAHFQVGDTVEAGDVLFTIDSTAMEYSIAQAQANLSKSQAQASLSLEQAQTNLNNYTANIDEGLNASLLQAENSVLTAENSLQSANNDYRSARQNYLDALDEGAEDSQLTSLRNARVSAELKVESAQLALENAKASLEAVKKQVQESAQSSEYSLRSAELSTNFSADYISLQQMQETLADYNVTAPIGGVIEQRNVDPYDMVSTGVASYVISNKERATITFHVAESALEYMQPGDTVTLEKDSQTAVATISEVSTMVDSASGLYTVKATVDSAPFEMRSGSTIKLYADTQKVENEMMIPIDAVYYDNGQPYVYIFQNNTANRVDIETGISDTANIQVVSGLSLSDQIIVTWSANLMDGVEVYLPGTAPAVDEGEEVGPAGEAPDGQAPGGEERLDKADTGDNEPADAQEGAGQESGDDQAPDGEDEEDAQ